MQRETSSSFFHSLRFKYGIVLTVFLVVAGYFLWQEHEAHILQYLPLLLILGFCVGMNMFMHGSHGHGKSEKHEGPMKQIESRHSDE